MKDPWWKGYDTGWDMGYLSGERMGRLLGEQAGFRRGVRGAMCVSVAIAGFAGLIIFLWRFA